MQLNTLAEKNSQGAIWYAYCSNTWEDSVISGEEVVAVRSA